MYWRLTQPFISGDVGDDQRMSCSMLAPAWQFDPNRFLSSLLSTGYQLGTVVSARPPHTAHWRFSHISFLVAGLFLLIFQDFCQNWQENIIFAISSIESAWIIAIWSRGEQQASREQTPWSWNLRWFNSGDWSLIRPKHLYRILWCVNREPG